MFERNFSNRIIKQLQHDSVNKVAYVLGSAGMGETTGVRIAFLHLSKLGMYCWEHDSEFALDYKAWGEVDKFLIQSSRRGALFIDDAHHNLEAVNDLVELLATRPEVGLQLVLTSSKSSWNPRIKTAAMFTHGIEYNTQKLSTREIDSLLGLLENKPEISTLVEKRFLGFSKAERRRRLVERCESDMFVCMKNIFGTEAFDNIVLTEFDELPPDYQEIYRRIAGMEFVGVNVHRQLVLRALNVRSENVSRILNDLEGIIEEHASNTRDGIYTWTLRHYVVAKIVAQAKINNDSDLFELLDGVVDNLNPSYPIELRSVDELCAPGKGIGILFNKQQQNVLFRKLISIAPARRFPRHRLISNLIDMSEYDDALTEIRVYENTIRKDSTAYRYTVQIELRKSQEHYRHNIDDRIRYAEKSCTMAEGGCQKYLNNKHMLKTYLESATVYAKLSNDKVQFDNAINKAKFAYQTMPDPMLRRTINQYEKIGAKL